MNSDHDIEDGPGHPALPCSFDKLILQRRQSCSRAVRTLVAEREVVGCSKACCARRCGTYFSSVLARGRFLNRGVVDKAGMPYSRIFRFQSGAILALRLILDDPHSDIDTLVEKAHVRPGSFEQLPYDIIIREIAASRMRRRVARR